MRDNEFAKEFARLSNRLEMFFTKRMRKTVSLSDRAQLAEDLAQQTGLKILEYTRQEKYANESIEKLLFQKANNIWNNFIISRCQQHEHIPLSDEMREEEPSVEHHMQMATTIAFLKRLSNPKSWQAMQRREAGFTDPEIAAELGVKQNTLRKMISRQIQKILDTYDPKKFA